MRNKKPPFEITEAALSEVMEISELVGKISSTQNLSTSPILRRQNRIRTIYSSLAIEQNTLSLEQVTAVLSGKRVLAPPKDIAEVKNAYEIYDHLAELNPYSMDDLLLAHRTMMQGLVREAGEFRSGPVGVVDNKGNVLHFGTLPQYVPSLICNALKISPDYLLRDALEDNEVSEIRELAALWESTSPSQQEIAAAMIRAVLERRED